MNTRDSIRWFWLAAVCLTFLCFANKAATQSQIPTQKPDVKTGGGLTTVTFYLEHGDLTANLPDDIRAVLAEPKGQTKDERAKNQGWNATATVVTTRFDFCLQDDSNPRTVILINTLTGEYIFPQPSGANLGGSGTVTRKDCVITLTDNQPDRKVQGKIDPCIQTGGASVQLVSPKVKFTITDRNTRDNTCACGPGCK